jgi:hypothetical protein
MSKLQELIKTINRKTNTQDQAKYMQKFLEIFLNKSVYWCVSPWVGQDHAYPVLGTVENNISCLYIFTDVKMATKFGTAYGITSPDKKNVLTMSLPMTALKSMLEEYAKTGVKAVVIDCGEDSLCIMIEGLLKLLEE